MWDEFLICCSVAQSCLTLCDPMNCSTPGFPVLHHIPEFVQTHVHWVSDVIQPSHPLSSSSPPALNLSQSFPSSRSFPTSQLFVSGEGDQGRRSHTYIHFTFSSLNYPCFSFSISPSSEYSGLISFRIDRFDLLAVKGTLKNLFQQHSSKATILWHSTFFTVQLSHPYMTTGKTIALIIQTFVSNVSAF